MADAAEKLAQALWAIGNAHGQLIWSDPAELRPALILELAGENGISSGLIDAVIAGGGLGVPGRLASGVNADTQVTLLVAAAEITPELAHEAILVWWTVVRTLAPSHAPTPARASVGSGPDVTTDLTAAPHVRPGRNADDDAAALSRFADELDRPSAQRIKIARIAGLVTVILTVAGAAIVFRNGVGSQPFDKSQVLAAPRQASTTSAASPSSTVAPSSSAAASTTAATSSTAAALNPPVTTAAPVGGDYVSLAPQRLVDTRSGLGVADAQPGKRPTVTASVAGRVGTLAPQQVKAAVLNITVAEPSQAGYLTVAPFGSTPPAVSQLAFSSGTSVASTLVISRVDAAGLVVVRLSEGTNAHVMVDLMGYFTTARSASNLGVVAIAQPSVLIDTRPSGALGAGKSVDVPLPASDAGAVLGVTVTGANAPGYVTVFGGPNRPDTSAVNFSGGRDATGMSFVVTGNDHLVHVFNGSTAPAHVVVFEVARLISGPSDQLVLNIDGTAAQDGRSAPYPFRTVDSRGKSTCPTTLGGGVSNISSIFPKAKALLLSITVANASASSYMTAYSGATAPSVASLNFASGETRSNLAFVPISGDRVNLVCGAGNPEYVIDVIAAFE